MTAGKTEILSVDMVKVAGCVGNNVRYTYNTLQNNELKHSAITSHGFVSDHYHTRISYYTMKTLALA